MLLVLMTEMGWLMFDYFFCSTLQAIIVTPPNSALDVSSSPGRDQQMLSSVQIQVKIMLSNERYVSSNEEVCMGKDLSMCRYP